ncbi:MAG TPA: hypothetical protein PLJ47_09750, partial [Candidatus Hydrogenedentes bacterium]|nr:hypothetical protein [Candidatus Hydrogenedentota bacterium]
ADDQRVLCEISAHRLPTEAGTLASVATVYHFDYSDSSTIRSVVNLTDRQVMDVERLPYYSPPLAPEEEIQARDLAVAASAEAKALVAANPDIKIELMPHLNVVPNDPLFGHRMVDVIFVPDPNNRRTSLRVSVDLTAAPRAAAVALEQADAEAPPQTVEFHFPLQARSDDQETGWRITFDRTSQSERRVLRIVSAEFKRSRIEDWVQVLGDTRLAEMFVPYNDGAPRYFDITGIGGDLLQLDKADLGPECLGNAKLYFEDRVAVELHDGKNLWFDTSGKSIRAEEVHVWGVRTAGNYVYLILYAFRSDGTVSMHCGATAHNHDNEKSDNVIHPHLATWRVNVALGKQAENKIEVVEWESSPNWGGVAKNTVSAFNQGLEGGIPWNADRSTRLRITSTTLKNSHNPAEYIGYELVSVRHGNLRTYGPNEEWTHKDFWVTAPPSASGGLELKPAELPKYVQDSENLAGKPATIWVNTGLIHRPRDEDFGKEQYNSYAGVALTAWSSIELKPRNFLAKSPFYKN